MKGKLKCVVALLLCMTMVFGTNLSTLADTNTAVPQTVQVQEAEQTAQEGEAAQTTGEQQAKTAEVSSQEQQGQQQQEEMKESQTEEPGTQEAEKEVSKEEETQAAEEISEAAKAEENQAGAGKEEMQKSVEVEKETAGESTEKTKSKETDTDKAAEQQEMAEETEILDYNSMSNQEISEHLNQASTDSEFDWIIGQLNSKKRQELYEYQLQQCLGEKGTHTSKGKNFSNAAPILSSSGTVMTMANSLRKAKEEQPSGTARGLVINKSLQDYDPETGKGMINLEAFVTGNVTTSYKSVPLDIVLVLDQSGSMGDPFGTETDYQELQNTTNDQAKRYADQGNLYYWTEDGYKDVTVETESTYEKYVVKEFLGGAHKPSYKELYNVTRYSHLYYYDQEAGQYYLINVDREGSFLNYNYTVTYKNGNQTITIGTASQSGDTEFPEDIYQISTSTYVYSYMDETQKVEIDRSNGRNGQAPSNLYYYGKKDVSRLEALKNAATQFITEVRKDAVKSQVNHRIAIAGFASQSGDGNNTEILTLNGTNSGSVGVAYNSLNNNNYKNALVGSSDPIIDQAINALAANGATRTDLGMEMAEKIFAQNPLTDADKQAKRQRVVIVLSDGNPTSYSDFDNDVASDAVEYAYDIKHDYSATVYTVGIFEGANADNTNPSRDATANTFMQALSSNYLYAQGNQWGDWYMTYWYERLGERNPELKGQSYYLSAKDSSGLNDVFDKISSQIGGADNTELDENTVVQDVISKYFEFAGNSKEDVKVYTADCTGVNMNGNEETTYTFADRQLFTDANVEMSRDKKTFQVTNFDFSENYVGLANNTPRGKKLIIQIPIEYKEDMLFGGNNIPTNAAGSGVYKGKDCYGTFISPVINQQIDYKIGSKSQTIYLGNSASLEKLMNYIQNYNPDGVKNEFVTIVYTLMKNDTKCGELVIPAGTSAEDCSWTWESGIETSPENCETYVLQCKVTPVTVGDQKNPGVVATEQTYTTEDSKEEGSKNPQIHVLKPTIKAKDHFIFLGDSENFENTWEVPEWSDFAKHSEIPSVEGQAPQMKIDKTNLEFVAGTELPENGEYYPEEDSNFIIAGVQINGKTFQKNSEDFKVVPCIDVKHNNCYKQSSDERNHDFTVHVVAGEIDITKILKNANDGNNTPEGDPIFTFKIEKLGTGDTVDKIWYRTIRFDEKNLSTGENRAEAELLNGLEKGRYRITELTTQKYSFSGVTGTITEDTNYTSDITGRAITFKIGNRINGSENKFARTIRAEFTNEKTGPSTNTDTDVVVNRFVKENGEWTIKQILNPGQGQILTDPTGSNMNDNK